MAFVVEVFRLHSVKEAFLVWWFNKFSDSARRKRLHGWRMWHDYCVENKYEPTDMSKLPNPAIVVADFVASLEMVDTQIYLIKEAVTAVKSLMEVAEPKNLTLLKDSQILEEALRAASTGVKGTSKYRTIWRLQILLDYMRSGPPHDQLSWQRLMARAAALFMIFIPCRPVGAWRLRPSTERWASDGKSVEIQAKEKMDHGKGTSALLLREGPVANLCPLRVYLALREQAAKRGLSDTLWGTEKGVPYKQASSISRLLKILLQEAGIPSNYTAYSIRHALITALFDMGLSEPQVNAYTGHSNNAHTALTHYFHLDGRWVGEDLAVPKEMPIPAAAVGVINSDNLLLQSELHEGEEDTEDNA
jgi:hypothetical protein